MKYKLAVKFDVCPVRLLKYSFFFSVTPINQLIRIKTFETYMSVTPTDCELFVLMNPSVGRAGGVSSELTVALWLRHAGVKPQPQHRAAV